MMGYKGDFVDAFASMMNKLWDSEAFFSVWPWRFKRNLSKVNEEFAGTRQHDSHDFLITLLGSLHEELNVRIKKPYIENPENRKDSVELSHEFWSNFLQRNWSFLVFLFHGQLRSTIECQTCGRENVLYEPYSNISLPVPHSNAIMVPIVVQCIPQELLNILTEMQNVPSKKLPVLSLGRKGSYIGDHLEVFKKDQKREKTILVYIYINQTDTVAYLE